MDSSVNGIIQTFLSLTHFLPGISRIFITICSSYLKRTYKEFPSFRDNHILTFPPSHYSSNLIIGKQKELTIAVIDVVSSRYFRCCILYNLTASNSVISRLGI